ncbi:hypothetical protein SynA1560_02401 [Synechococcus sp. A15-60]|nr:hypothetical protein SynA1560_02401 [Synechococcus sp. A15-60]
MVIKVINPLAATQAPGSFALRRCAPEQLRQMRRKRQSVMSLDRTRGTTVVRSLW